jgi:uncharacterized protein YndB with AHSA1/START domain
MARAITVDTELPYPPAAVWRALTDPAALAEWMMPVHDFAPVVGQRFQVRAKPMPGWDGIVDCEVLDVDEPHRLAYSWRGSRMRAGTTVRWTLDPLPGGGTRLRLEHTGFTGLGGAVLGLMHRGGWRKFVARRLPAHLGESTRLG